MSEKSDDRRRDSQHTSDVHSYRTGDPHTAIPDWVALAPGLGPEARQLIMASLILEKRSGPPTRRQLAAALGVDERSIYRWLREIGAAGALSIRREKRRRINVFHKPKPDHMISDRAISDRLISDRPIRFTHDRVNPIMPSEGHETSIPDQAISDPSVGGVGDHVTHEKDSPTTPRRAPLKTALARWAKQYGMVAARDIDDPALDYNQYKRWIEDHRAMGWEWRQIVSTLREAPLEPQPSDPLSNDWIDPAQLADDQADDQAAQVDSTSRQLARRVEQDRLEALARGAGLVNEKGKPI